MLVEFMEREGRLDGDRKLREEASKGHYTPDLEAWYERRIAETAIQARNEALEQAASYCDEYELRHAKEIRALKTSLAPERNGGKE